MTMSEKSITASATCNQRRPRCFWGGGSEEPGVGAGFDGDGATAGVVDSGLTEGSLGRNRRWSRRLHPQN